MLIHTFAFLYTNKERSQREINKAIPFTIATKRIKFLGINLPKETKDLYSENYKILIEDNANRQTDIPCPWIGRINMVKMIVLPKAIYRFSAVPFKLPIFFPTESEPNILQFMWKHQRPQIPQSWDSKTQLKESDSESSDYTTKLQLSRQLIATIITTILYWHKKKYRSMVQDRKPRGKHIHLCMGAHRL